MRFNSGEIGQQQKRRRLEALVVELEWRRCQRDKEYCFGKYFYIQSAESEMGRCLFSVKPFQRETLHALDDETEVIIGKSRQLGLTTLAMCDSFHNGFYHGTRYELLVVSKSQEDAETNLSMVDHVYRFLPDWMKRRGPRREDEAKGQITFRQPDGSLFRAVSIVGTPKRGAGKTANRIVLDEYALIDKPAQVFRALQPATMAARSSEFRRGAVFVIVSTFRGGRNAHARQFMRAHRGEDTWKAIFWPVTKNFFLGPKGSGDAAERVAAAKRAGVQPDPADEKLAESFWAEWRDMQKSGSYADEPWTFFSEYPRDLTEALRESGRNRFRYLPAREDVFDLPFHGWFKMRNGTVELELATTDDEILEAPWHFAQLPEEIDRDKEIVIGADTAGGQLGDYSTAIALQAAVGPDFEYAANILAAYWRNDVSPADFAAELNLAGRYFAPTGQQAALLAVERAQGGSGHGETINRLRQSKYPGHRLYRHTPPTSVRQKRSAEFGYPMNKATKPEAIRALDRLLTAKVSNETGELEPVCLLYGMFPELLDELATFVILNPDSDRSYERLGADAGGNDDLVMALAIGAVVLEGAHNKFRLPTNRQSAHISEDAVVAPRDGAFVVWNPRTVVEKAKQEARARAIEEERRWRKEQKRTR